MLNPSLHHPRRAKDVAAQTEHEQQKAHKQPHPSQPAQEPHPPTPPPQQVSRLPGGCGPHGWFVAELTLLFSVPTLTQWPDG
jgi:hypothetical protein